MRDGKVVGLVVLVAILAVLALVVDEKSKLKAADEKYEACVRATVAITQDRDQLKEARDRLLDTVTSLRGMVQDLPNEQAKACNDALAETRAKLSEQTTFIRELQQKLRAKDEVIDDLSRKLKPQPIGDPTALASRSVREFRPFGDTFWRQMFHPDFPAFGFGHPIDDELCMAPALRQSMRD